MIERKAKRAKVVVRRSIDLAPSARGDSLGDEVRSNQCSQYDIFGSVYLQLYDIGIRYVIVLSIFVIILKSKDNHIGNLSSTHLTPYTSRVDSIASTHCHYVIKQRKPEY